MNSWAVMLNGVMFTSACEGNPTYNCGQETVVIDALDATPDGLGLPGLRTEDTEFFQRDGVQHYNDYYEPRIVTLTGTIGPGECDCSAGECSCLSVREQLFAAAQAWGRTCCDTELVIFPPCDDPRFNNCDDNPVPGEETLRVNLVTNPSIEIELDPWIDITNSSIVRDTTLFWNRTASLLLTSDAAGAEASFGSASGTSGFPVVEDTDYIASVYMLAPVVVRNVRISIDWYDAAGVLLSSSDGATLASSNIWQRISVSAASPVGAVFARLRGVMLNPTAAAEAIHFDGFLLEQSTILGTYFDGATADVDPAPAVGSEQILYDWSGEDDTSTSSESRQTYIAGPCEISCNEHTLIGPYGIVGRPRVFTYQPLFRSEHIYEFVARFDAVDQRGYLLDACGTPGVSECVELVPGSQLRSRCYPRCYEGGGNCYTTAVGSEGGSVPVTDITVCGTQRSFPTITFNPTLNNPVLQNLTTGEFIEFNGVIGEDDEPVVIYTEDMVAFQGDQNVTYLLGGSGSFSLPPGDYELRLLVDGTLQPDPDLPNATGTANVCWRDTVVAL